MKLSYIIDNIIEAKTNLLRNMPRTILTSLGIVIGITSVIILVAITDGAKNIIEQQLVSLGAKTIVLKPIGRTASGVYRGCLLYTSPSPRDRTRSRMPSSA